MHKIFLKFLLTVVSTLLLFSCNNSAKVSTERSPAIKQTKAGLDNFKIIAPTITQTDTSITVVWQEVDAAKSYTFTVGIDSSCVSKLLSFDHLTVTQESLSLSVAGTYYICVTAIDSNGIAKSAQNSGLKIV